MIYVTQKSTKIRVERSETWEMKKTHTEDKTKEPKWKVKVLLLRGLVKNLFRGRRGLIVGCTGLKITVNDANKEVLEFKIYRLHLG